VHKKSILPFIIFISIAMGFLLGKFLYQSDNIFYAQNKDFQKLRSIIELIEDNYEDKIDVFDFMHESLLRKLSEIDPYSYFLDNDAYDDAAMDNSGIFYGLGISYASYNDTIRILKVYENSPAELSGLKAFDQILTVNGIDVVGLMQDSVAMMFKTKKKFNLEVKYFLSGEISEIIVKKKDIPLNSITFTMIKDRIGYIKIEKFSDNTDEFFVDAAEELLKEGIDYLILDLRDNPGGILTASVNILDEFFASKDTLIVTKTKDDKEEVFYSTENDLLANVQLIVLINSGSASASELVSVALQDYDRALFMGTRTYGKGVFQQNMKTIQNDFLHITTGKYFGPTGRWIDRREVISNTNIEYFETKHGRFVSSRSGVIPEIYYNGYSVQYLVDILDNYAFEIVIKNKELFNDVDFSDIEEISTSITDTSLIFDEYFGSSEPLKLAFAKFFIDESEYQRHLVNSDSLIIKALQIIDNDQIEAKIYESDTVFYDALDYY
jgi:carboxyl-terminal processing protease